jgi:retron-type reverse transcriptase
MGCWTRIFSSGVSGNSKRDAAPGFDRVGFYEYRENLDENIANLVKRLKQKSYRAKLVRRQYIPKINGKLRPLGIPATDDKVLQFAVAKILEAIYEEDFLDVSYGYRPRIGPQNAVRDLTEKLQFGRFSHIVEADIRGFFDPSC